MKLILAFVFTILYFSSSSQNLKDKTDEFNGFRRVSTGFENASRTLRFNVSGGYFSNKDKVSDTAYSISFIFLTSLVTSFSHDEKIIFKFNDGSMVPIQRNGDYEISGTNEVASSSCDITDSLFAKLKTNRIAKIRIESSNKNFDFDISEKKGDLISTYALAIRTKLTTPK